MTPLEKFAAAVRIAGFGAVASEYIKLGGEEAPEVWDLRNTLTHLGTKLAYQAQDEVTVRTGLGALRDLCPGVKTAFNTDFTAEFHAVNSLARSNTKLASHGLEAPLAERRLILWNNMKQAAETTKDPVAHLAKIAIQVWSETERSGEKTASSRDEREAFAVSFASNYLVDQKIAQLNLPANVKAKLASVSAEAAMFDLNRVVRTTGYDEHGRVKSAGFMDWFRGKQQPAAPQTPRLRFDINELKKHMPELQHQDLPNDEAIYFNHGGNESFFHVPAMEDQLNQRGAETYYPELAGHIRNSAPYDPNTLADLKSSFMDFKSAMYKEALDPRIIGALVGATGGGALGAWDDKDNRLRGGVMGALMGAPLGAVGGHVYNEYAQHFAQQATDAAKKMTDANAALQKAIGAAEMLANSGQGANALQQLTGNEDAIRNHFAAGNRSLPLSVAQHLSPDDMQALHSALGHLNTRVV